LEFSFEAKGHENILSQHRTTWQVTKEDHLSLKGDCIIGISSNVACVDLPEWLKEHLKGGGKITVELQVDEIKIVGIAEGHPDLTFEDTVDMVFRKSDFISPRTVAINSSIVANDLPWPMIKLLKEPDCVLQIKLGKL
jgi:hypothetical protein